MSRCLRLSHCLESHPAMMAKAIYCSFCYNSTRGLYGEGVRMNTFEICRSVCSLSENVLGAGIIVDNKVIALEAKPGVPIPSHERMEKLFFQTSLIANIMRGNSDVFGQARYFTLHYKNA